MSRRIRSFLSLCLIMLACLLMAPFAISVVVALFFTRSLEIKCMDPDCPHSHWGNLRA